MSRVLVALGSNLGDREALLIEAVRRLDAAPGFEVDRVSAFIETEPVGGPEQGAYLNGALVATVTLAPLEVLDLLQSVENAAGRVRVERWGPRTLDLDLLLYDDRVVDEPRLEVPHPRLHERSFVLDPAVEIARDWVHPTLGRTLGELREALA